MSNFPRRGPLDMRKVTAESLDRIDERDDLDRDELLLRFMRTAYPSLVGQNQ